MPQGQPVAGRGMGRGRGGGRRGRRKDEDPFEIQHLLPISPKTSPGGGGGGLPHTGKTRWGIGRGTGIRSLEPPNPGSLVD